MVTTRRFPTAPGAKRCERTPADWYCMVSSAGRISLNILQRMFMRFPAKISYGFIQAPVLVGSAVHIGTLPLHERTPESRDMNRTILFEPSEDTDHTASASEASSTHLPVGEERAGDDAGNFFSIGRIDGNDIHYAEIMPYPKNTPSSSPNAPSIC